MKYFSNTVKRKVLKALDNGMSVIQAKQKFGISTFTIYKWRKEQQENVQTNEPNVTINGVDADKFLKVQVTPLEDALRATIKQKDQKLDEQEKQLAVMRSIIIDQACQLHSLKTNA